MKRFLINIIVFAVFILLPVNVFATGNITASPSSLTIEVGSTKTFTITATNTIGDVYISSNNSGVASVSTGEWGTGMIEEGQTKSGTVTVTGVSEGNASIILTLDAATFDGEDLAGQTRTVTVNVVPKPAPNNNNNNNSNNNSNNSNNNNNNNSNNNNSNNNNSNNNNSNNNNSNNNNSNNNNDNKSTNNKIKDISIEGYNLVKVDDNNYTLSVSKDVDNINIKATAEDSKAKVTGAGNHKLKDGENVITLVVTSESGSQNKINIKVTRKESFGLDDLDNALKSSNTANIIINKDSKLSTQDLSKIKDSGKVVSLIYKDDKNKELYSWIIDGSKINDYDELYTGISFSSTNEDKISKLSNYADGINISMNHKGKIPRGVRVRLFVGEKYSNGDKVNVYYFNETSKKLEIAKENVTVEDGYIVFFVKKGSDYFITKSIIDMSNDVVKLGNIISIISVICVLIVIILIIFFLLFKRLKKNYIVDKEVI